jgi:hypothetical protein
MPGKRKRPAAKQSANKRATASASAREEKAPQQDVGTGEQYFEEVHELQQLNKRVEYYILRQREQGHGRDGWLAEMSALRVQHESEGEQNAARFEAQLETVRKNLQKQAQDNATLTQKLHGVTQV